MWDKGLGGAYRVGYCSSGFFLFTTYIEDKDNELKVNGDLIFYVFCVQCM